MAGVRFDERSQASLHRLPAMLPPLLLALTGLGFSPPGHGEFALNFSGVTSTTVVQGDTDISGQTPFTAVEPNQAGVGVVDPDTGVRYWHYVMGDPATGFAQEVYIQATGSSCGQNSICTASGGSSATDPDFNLLGANTAQTGNGTGNPNRVIVRQVIGGTWNAGTQTWSCDTAFCGEFVKTAYANKPKITQGINESDFTASFVMDMSAVAMSNNTTDLTIIDKDTASTGASLINTQTVKNSAGDVIATFDMAKDAQTTYINGGKYTYTNGSGTLQANGNYVYVDGAYNQKAVDYSVFLDDSLSNPWAYPTAKP